MKVRVREWLKKVIQRYREDERLQMGLSFICVIIIFAIGTYVVKTAMDEQL